MLKIGKDYELIAFIEAEIREGKKLPYAVAEETKKGSGKNRRAQGYDKPLNTAIFKPY